MMLTIQSHHTPNTNTNTLHDFAFCSDAKYVRAVLYAAGDIIFLLHKIAL